MKKILLLTQNYYPSVGGGIRYKVDFVSIFRNLGFQVDILCTNTENCLSVEEECGGQVIRTPLNFNAGSTSISLSTFSYFKRIVNEYDYLHFNFPSPFSDMCLVIFDNLINKNIGISCYYHADIVPKKKGSYFYNKIVTKQYLKRVDKIFVSNPTIICSSPHLRNHKDKIAVIPFGINPQTHFLGDCGGVSPIKNGNIDRYNGQKQDLNILFVGRLSRYKGVDLLIKACRDLRLNLNIVGTGPLHDELKVIARNSTANIIFHGFVPNSKLPQLYSDADVFVLPSIDEGEAFGYVLIEAMYYSCALISTELGTGTSWVNQHQVSGLVISPQSIVSIKDAIQYFIDNPDKLSDFKNAAKNRFLENFSFDSMKKKLIEEVV